VFRLDCSSSGLFVSSTGNTCVGFGPSSFGLSRHWYLWDIDASMGHRCDMPERARSCWIGHDRAWTCMRAWTSLNGPYHAGLGMKEPERAWTCAAGWASSPGCAGPSQCGEGVIIDNSTNNLLLTTIATTENGPWAVLSRTALPFDSRVFRD